MVRWLRWAEVVARWNSLKARPRGNSKDADTAIRTGGSKETKPIEMESTSWYTSVNVICTGCHESGHIT